MTVPGSAAPEKVVSRRSGVLSRRLAGTVIGLVISATALYFAVRGIRFDALAAALRSTRPIPLVGAVILAVMSSLFRALRWRALFPADVAVPLRYYFTNMMIGYLGNNLLPARAGDVIRTVLFGKRTGVGISRTAATLVVERVVDAASLLAIVGFISFVVPLPARLVPAGRIASVGCIGALLVLSWIAFRRKTSSEVLTSSSGIRAVIARFVDGLHALRNARSMATVLLFTAAIWFVESIMVFLVLQAARVSAPPLAAVFLLVVLSLGLLIPAGPAAIGSYEFLAVLALSAFAIEKTRALSVAIVLHAMVFCTATTIGLICLWVENISFGALPRASDAQP